MNVQKLLFLFILFEFLGGYIYAQQAQKYNPANSSKKIDKLLTELEIAKDTQRVKILNNLATTYHTFNPSKAQEYAERAMLLSQELNYQLGLANALNNLGLVYNMLGNYQQSMGSYLESVRVSQSIGDKTGVANAYHNLGLAFKEKQDYSKALDFYERSLEIARQLDDKARIASPLNNIGTIYSLKKEYGKALKNYNEALALYTTLKDSIGIATALGNIGEVYLEQERSYQSLQYFLQALQIYENQLDWNRIAQLTQKIGNVYLQLGNLDQAEKLCKKSIEISRKHQLGNVRRDVIQTLSRIYARRENWQQAYLYQNLYVALQDSINREEKNKQITELQNIFESQRRQARLELLKKEKIIQKDEQFIKGITNYGVWVALFFISLFAFSLYRNNQKRKNANEILEAQKREITSQKDAIEDKNKALIEKHHEITEKNQAFEELLDELKRNNIRLTDSIRYAERIQRAILPTPANLKENFTDQFIIFKPKDVVSGDFYWFSQIENMRFLAVADCTGHGVPGAFMSIIGNTLLNEIINHEKVFDTDLILKYLHEGVRDSLKQNSTQNTDGMDIALCKILQESETQFQVQFSGAKSQIYLIKEGMLQEMRGDRKSIGGWQKEAQRTFSKQEIPLQKGDCIYLATDGYTDAADLKRKKIGYKKLAKTIYDNHQLNFTEQGAILLQQLYEHQKGVEQRDDITLVGIKL